MVLTTCECVTQPISWLTNTIESISLTPSHAFEHTHNTNNGEPWNYRAPLLHRCTCVKAPKNIQCIYIFRFVHHTLIFSPEHICIQCNGTLLGADFRHSYSMWFYCIRHTFVVAKKMRLKCSNPLPKSATAVILPRDMQISTHLILVDFCSVGVIRNNKEGVLIFNGVT